MKRTFINFSIKLGIITVILLGSVYALPILIDAVKMPMHALQIVGFLFFFTLLVYWVLLFAIKKYPGYFMHLMMGCNLLKLIIFCTFIFVIIYNHREAAVPNVVLFLTVYLVYTIFEVFSVFVEIKSEGAT